MMNLKNYEDTRFESFSDFKRRGIIKHKRNYFRDFLDAEIYNIDEDVELHEIVGKILNDNENIQTPILQFSDKFNDLIIPNPDQLISPELLVRFTDLLLSQELGPNSLIIRREILKIFQIFLIRSQNPQNIMLTPEFYQRILQCFEMKNTDIIQSVINVFEAIFANSIYGAEKLEEVINTTDFIRIIYDSYIMASSFPVQQQILKLFTLICHVCVSNEFIPNDLDRLSRVLLDYVKNFKQMTISINENQINLFDVIFGLCMSDHVCQQYISDADFLNVVKLQLEGPINDESLSAITLAMKFINTDKNIMELFCTQETVEKLYYQLFKHVPQVKLQVMRDFFACLNAFNNEMFLNMILFPCAERVGELPVAAFKILIMFYIDFFDVVFDSPLEEDSKDSLFQTILAHIFQLPPVEIFFCLQKIFHEIDTREDVIIEKLQCCNFDDDLVEQLESDDREIAGLCELILQKIHPPE